MHDINEIERRIAAAFRRANAALDAAPSGSAVAAQELRLALESEREANAQLTERVRAIKEKQETMVSALERNVARLTEQLDAANLELARHKRVNTDLTDLNAALAASAREGVPDPQLLNRAMMTELDALRAQRSAEVAEMDAILSELKPLIGEVA